MAVTNVSIANRGLTLLSASRILSFEQDSEEARKVNAIFEDTRDALLEEHNWNFARAERELSLLSDDPVLDGWEYVYQLPSDCIRFVREQNDLPCAVFGNKLYSNASPMIIEYVKKETDPTKFSKGFVKALASRIAADLAFGITQNATFADKMDAIARQDLKDAKWSDASEGIGNIPVSGDFIIARQR